MFRHLGEYDDILMVVIIVVHIQNDTCGSNDCPVVSLWSNKWLSSIRDGAAKTVYRNSGYK